MCSRLLATCGPTWLCTQTLLSVDIFRIFDACSNSRGKVENVFEAKFFVTSGRNCYFFPGFAVAGNDADIDSFFIGYNRVTGIGNNLFSIHVLVLR